MQLFLINWVLLSVYALPGTVLRGLHVFSWLIFTTILPFIFQMMNLKFRTINTSAYSHKWYSQDLNLSLSDFTSWTKPVMSISQNIYLFPLLPFFTATSLMKTSIISYLYYSSSILFQVVLSVYIVLFQWTLCMSIISCKGEKT